MINYNKAKEYLLSIGFKDESTLLEKKFVRNGFENITIGSLTKKWIYKSQFERKQFNTLTKLKNGVK